MSLEKLYSTSRLLALSTMLIVILLPHLAVNSVAHEFSGDESATFLSVIKSIRVYSHLSGQFADTNTTIASIYAVQTAQALDEHFIEEIKEKNQRVGNEIGLLLAELQNATSGSSQSIKDIESVIAQLNAALDEAIEVRLDKAHLTNSTIMALTLADMVDKTLMHYGMAFGIGNQNGHDEHSGDHEQGSAMNDTVHSNSNMNNSMNEGRTMNMNMSMDGHNSDTIDEGNKNATHMEHENNKTQIASESDYESAREFAAEAMSTFEGIKSISPSNSTEALVNIERGLEELIHAIDAKEPHSEAVNIVHGKIHPNVQLAFNLQIIPEFPFPLIVAISVFALIVALGRTRSFIRNKWI